MTCPRDAGPGTRRCCQAGPVINCPGREAALLFKKKIKNNSQRSLSRIKTEQEGNRREGKRREEGEGVNVNEQVNSFPVPRPPAVRVTEQGVSSGTNPAAMPVSWPAIAPRESQYYIHSPCASWFLRSESEHGQWVGFLGVLWCIIF